MVVSNKVFTFATPIWKDISHILPIRFDKLTKMKERIEQIRLSKQMSYREFSEATGISASSLSSIANGRTLPTIKQVHAIHRRFPEISISWIMFGEGEMVEQPTSDGRQTLSGEQSHEAEINITATPVDTVNASNSMGSTVNPAHSMMPVDTQKLGQEIAREVVKNIDKPKRKITEIRVFYDDGTFDTFPGK